MNIKLVVCAFAAVLAGCGGGGGGGGVAKPLCPASSASCDVSALPAPPASTLGAAPVAATSYWTMDGYTYENGGNSAQKATTLSTPGCGEVPMVIAIVSTATLSGGDTKNGAYSGSAVTFDLLGASPGIYNLVPSEEVLIESNPANHPIYMTTQIGVGVNTGSSVYTATSGQVKVSQDSAGKYHFDTVTPLTVSKTQDVLGGVAGAPATMTLTIVDAY